MKNLYGQINYLVIIHLMLILYVSSQEARANLPSINIISIFQQQVTGTVTDQNGIPIPGVAVRIKESSVGTVTNADGNYSLIVSSDDILVFTYMGFQSMEILVDDQREINVRLAEDITALGEVEINAGYYHTTRRKSTGNISRVTAEEIELVPIVSPLQALEGRMAGVEVVTGSGGQPGAAPIIRIRGTNSLRTDGNFPMYIVDGVPINSTPIESNSDLGRTGIDPLSTMDLSNIESIEVLKDADATAIYGSRGANGVVLITTKRARQGKIELQTRLQSGVSTAPYRIGLIDTQKYLEIRKAAFENDGVEPTVDNAYDLMLWDQNRYTDWQELLFGGISPFLDVNLNVSGGSKHNYFRLTGSYHKQGTVFLGDYDYQRITSSLQAHHSSEDNRLQLDLSMNYGITDNNLTGYLSLTTRAFNLIPNAPRLLNEDGSLHWEEWGAVGLKNPMEGYFNTSNTIGQNLNSNFVVNYELLSGLKFRTNLGFTTYRGDEIVKRPIRSFDPANWQSLDHQSVHLKLDSNSWIVEPQLIYNKQIGENAFEALIGGTIQQRDNSILGLAGTGYVSELVIGNLNAADKVEVTSDQKTEYRYSAIFTRLGYNWKKKYYLNLTGRRDGSSRFGSGKRLANFGAIGAAWIFSEENYIQRKFPFLSFGKIRGSYGITGNDQIPDYGYLDAYEVTYAPGGLYPSQLANPDFSWEENKKLEFATDLGLFENRINLALSWFFNKSSNQLVGYVLPSLTGFNSVQANLPATVENTGWELELSSLNIQRKNFHWQSSINLSLPKNQLVEYPDIEQSPYASIYRVGEPLNISFVYQYEGLDPETGLYTVKDANEDGRIDSEDRTEIMDRGREFYGGIHNRIDYKNFSLQFLLQFVKQEGTFIMFKAGFIEPLPDHVYNALQQDNIYQKPSTSLASNRAYSNVVNSTFPITDASFLRLKSLSIGYRFPEPLIRKFGFHNGRLFITGQNLLTITNYKGLDPEQPIVGTSFGGLRTITAGLQFTL